jgi:hypothetical protein
MDSKQQKKLQQYMDKQNTSDENSILKAFRGVVKFTRDLGLRVIADTISAFLDLHLGGLLKHAWTILRSWIGSGGEGSLN